MIETVDGSVGKVSITLVTPSLAPVGAVMLSTVVGVGKVESSVGGSMVVVPGLGGSMVVVPDPPPTNISEAVQSTC